MLNTYYLRSFGCQMNAHDAERIRAALEAEGLQAVERPDDAAVLVYNTCTVRHSADERFAGHVSTAARLKRDDPSRLVIVSGCLPQADGEAFLARFPHVDVALGPQNLHRLADELHNRLADRRGDGEEASAMTAATSARGGFFTDGPHLSAELSAHRERPFQAWVQAMSGCTNFCSYCIVPYVRGPERSRPLPDIVAEVRTLVADGVREVTLLGQNVNAYGRDLAVAERQSFAQLLTAVDAVPGLARTRFMTSHPKDMSDAMINALATLSSVCEHVHLPAQAGSDRVLAAMRRGYTAQQYLDRVTALRAAVPAVSITSDLIAGFPGETEEDFSQTLELVRAAGFDSAFTFVYSPRTGTAAAALPGQVDDDVKRDRVERLVELTQKQAHQRRQNLVGLTVEVLVEGEARQPGRQRGRTRQNVTVNLNGQARPGAIVSVHITAATSTTLQGQVADA
ncbi:MAG: tRNA (N6-isopentenyl adenosine(37)-C2)-methylthiotransferase MiaB [Thermoleophilia bacterium]